MSAYDFGGSSPLFLGEEPEPEDGRPGKKPRRMLFLGGTMTAMGNMGLIYPLMLDPLGEGEEEEDPNP